METKNCPSCTEEINAEAKQCPHCQSYQHGFMRFMKDPVGGAFVGLAFVFILFYFVFDGVLYDRKIYAPIEHIKVSDTSMQFVDASCGRQVSVIGTIENIGTEALTDIVFDVEFYDSNGDLIDAISDTEYDLVLPAGSSKSFKVRGNSGANETLYASHKVAVAKAERDTL